MTRRDSGHVVALPAHNNTATFYFHELKKKKRKHPALMSPFFLQAELILSFGASKYRPYVGSALAIRLHCRAGG